MNRTLRKFSVLVLCGFVLAACGDDDDAKKSSSNEPEFPTEYSNNTVEQNKSNLQDNGITLVDKVTTLKSTSGIQTSIAFSEHLDGATLPDNIGGRTESSPAFKLLQTLTSLGKGKSTPGQALDGMRINAADFESFEQFYGELAGEYVYSKANDTWTYNKTGNRIVFKFPSTKTGSANNAEYAIYDYKGTKIKSELGGDDYAGDYPTGLKIDLTIDGAKKMEYAFSTSYDNGGTPTAISISVKIDTYTFLYELTNTNTEAKIDYSLTEGNTTLFALGARGKGSFAVDNIVDNADGALNDASAYFQIMNIKFSGQTNYAALQTALDKATTVQQKVDAYNANYKLIVFYADSKKKIADSEFYVGKETGEDYVCGAPYDMNQDGIVQPWERDCGYVETTRDVAEVRMVFQDGTKSDLETYTDVGFADLQTELEKFVDSLN